MGIDRVGLAPPPLAPTRTLDLHHRQSRRLQRPGQSDAVAAGALERDHHPRTRRMLGDPRDRIGVAALVIADHQRGDGDAAGRGQLQGMGIAVRVAADNGVDDLCQHGHAASNLLPGTGRWVGVGLGGVTERHICDESRAWHGQASNQANRWARPMPALPGTGQMKGTRFRGQIRSESPDTTDTDPDGSPPTTAAPTHSQIRRQHIPISRKSHERAGMSPTRTLEDSGNTS